MDGDVLCLGAVESGKADDGHDLSEAKFGDLAPAAQRHPRNEHAPHRGVLETPVLDSQEHLFDQFFGCVFRADRFAAVVEVEPRVPDRSERLFPLFGARRVSVPSRRRQT